MYFNGLISNSFLSVRLIAVYLFFVLFACQPSENKIADNDTTKVANDANQTGTTKEIEQPCNDSIHSINKIDTTFSFSRNETPYRGELKYKMQWTDCHGLNRFIISSLYDYDHGDGMAQIFAYQYTKGETQWAKVWQMNDFVKGIGCDLAIDILHFGIKDVDANGVAECTFIYTLDSRCDAVSVGTKLLLYVEGEKIVIRGISQQYLLPPLPKSIIKNDPSFIGRDSASYKRIDPGMFSDTSIFVRYASDLWDSLILKQNLDYAEETERFRKKHDQSLNDK